MNVASCRNMLQEWKLSMGMVLAGGGFFSERLCEAQNLQDECISADNCVEYFTNLTDWDDAYIGEAL